MIIINLASPTPSLVEWVPIIKHAHTSLNVPNLTFFLNTDLT